MDNHLHTRFSDGKDSLHDMILTAIKLGYERITFTDHVRKNTDWLDAYVLEISNLRSEYSMDIDIGIGVEAKIINLCGDIDFNTKYKDKIDFVLAAIHRIPIGGDVFIHGSDVHKYVISELFKCVKDAMFNALKNPIVDVLAHPFALGTNEIWLPFFSQGFCEQLRMQAISECKYLEYNVSKYNGCVQKDYWQFPGFKIWIGSDSHSSGEMIINNKAIANIELVSSVIV
jgi:histidinol phosphatase-like PHP family hydrolase